MFLTTEEAQGAGQVTKSALPGRGAENPRNSVPSAPSADRSCGCFDGICAPEPECLGAEWHQIKRVANYHQLMEPLSIEPKGKDRTSARTPAPGAWTGSVLGIQQIGLLGPHSSEAFPLPAVKGVETSSMPRILRLVPRRSTCRPLKGCQYPLPSQNHSASVSPRWRAN